MRQLSILVLLVCATLGGYWLALSGIRPTDLPWVGGLLPRTSQETTATGGKVASTKGEPARRILFYRNPMGLPDTSPTPKKDWMGMDYIPVYEGEDEAESSIVKISVEKVQRLGVRTEAVSRRNMMRPLRAVGSITFDERRISLVSMKFDGWIETLHVNATGSQVKKGDALMAVYSPELVQAQQEYLVALTAAGDQSSAGRDAQAASVRLGDGALQRLRNLDVAADQIQRLQRQGTADRLVTVRAPNTGVVIEKMAIEGMRFMAGEPLYRIADMSRMWLIADVFEQDLGLILPGQTAKVTVNAYPGRAYTGRVDFIYPALSRETRTARVRIEIANPDNSLKADMYATVEVSVAVGRANALAVPESAVLDSGTRQSVLIERGEGRYEPRAVRLGAAADGYVEILEGVAAEDKVVVGANFLIDAESNLKAVLRSFTAPAARISGKGVVTAFTPGQNAITIEHEPIPALQWPEMEMEFDLAPGLAVKGIQVGRRVEFTLSKGGEGGYVIDRIVSAGSGG